MDNCGGVNTLARGFNPAALMGQVYRGPAAKAPAFKGMATTIDASKTQFRLGTVAPIPIISEALQAIPWIKADPAFGSVAGSSVNPNLYINVQGLSGAPPSPAFFDNTLATLVDTSTAPAAITSFPIGRIGARFRIPRLDPAATAAGSAQSYATMQASAASAIIVHQVDLQMATGAASAPAFNGFPPGANGLCKTLITQSNSFDQDMRNLMASCTASGGSGGEGVHCLMGGSGALMKLMATSSGQGGASGWRLDPRTGLNVYHYMGLPYYRMLVNEGSGTSQIYAANLGPTGLNMVYLNGTPDTFGLTAEMSTVTTATGLFEVTVYGAFALVLWDVNALQGVNVSLLSI